MIKTVVARKHFNLDSPNGHSVAVAKGDKGQLLGHRHDVGYTIIINDKTVNITDRKLFRYLFRIEEPKVNGEEKDQVDNANE